MRKPWSSCPCAIRDDSEATIFYALALNEATELADKTYARQLKAGALLEQVFAQQPDHPGVAHYIIHSYDYEPLAVRALPAARHYAAIAPSAPHALHMPSHIFSMLGLWHDVITSNTAAEASSKAYAAKHLPGQTLWLHQQDFRIHAHLQLAQDQEAKRIVDERNTIEKLVARAAAKRDRLRGHPGAVRHRARALGRGGGAGAAGPELPAGRGDHLLRSGARGGARRRPGQCPP